VVGKEEKRSCPLEAGGGVAVREVEDGVRLGVGTVVRRECKKVRMRVGGGKTRRTSRKGGREVEVGRSRFVRLPPTSADL